MCLLRRLTDILAALPLLLLLNLPAAAQEIPVLTLRSGTVIDLMTQAARYEGDPASSDDARYPLALRQAFAQATPAPAPWPDYRALWLVVRLSNQNTISDWMLRMDTDPLYLPQVTVLDDAGNLVSVARRLDARAALPETGAEIGVGQRFPISVPPGESRIVLLRVNAIGFGSLVADILSREAWTAWAVRHQAILALAVALIAATGVYTMVIGTGIGRVAYLWYGLHCATVLVFWLNLYGVFADLIGFTDHTRLIYKASSMALVAIGPLLTRALLDVQDFAPRLSKALLACGIAGFALIVPIIALYPWPELQRAWLRGPDWQYLIAVISYCLIFPAGFLALWHRVAGARWFVIGWLTYIAGTFYTIAAYFGFVPFTGMILFVGFITASWEVLFSAQALATRIRLLQSEKIEAQAQRRAQQDFLAAISHDLRTPLNAILGAAAMPDDRNLTEPARLRLAEIRRAGKILLALISDLLDRASLSSGNLTLLKRPVALQDCVQEAVDLVRDRAEEKRLRLRVNIDPALPHSIIGDELRLKQILFNLVENAVKFTPDGEVTVIASALPSPVAPRLAIAVRDSGPGIPLAEQDIVFAPYRRGTTSEGHGATSATGGSSRGLGLSIARDLARAMDGDLTVDSAPGEGSCFTLTLPLVSATPVDRTIASQFILLVDDLAINRETGTALLRSEGHILRSCGSGEALRRVEQDALDLVLLDLQMPEIDGFELARRIRHLRDERKANLPVIALSAHIDESVRQRLAAIGVFDILQKPLNLESLNAVLQQSIETAPRLVNYALQLRVAGEVGHASWIVALRRFHGASESLLHEIAAAQPMQRAELLHRLAGMAGALGLEAVSHRATALEQRQRNGHSVLDALPELRDLWLRSLARCIP